MDLPDASADDELLRGADWAPPRATTGRSALVAACSVIMNPQRRGHAELPGLRRSGRVPQAADTLFVVRVYHQRRDHRPAAARSKERG